MSFYISNFNEKNYLKFFILSVISIIVFIFIFNIFIEPYGNAKIKIKNINEQTIVNYSQKEKIDLLQKEHIKVNALIIGSSQSARIQANILTKLTNQRWINFAIGTSMPTEHFHYLKYFFDNFNIKTVLYGVEDQMLYGKYKHRGNTLQDQEKKFSSLDYLTLETLYRSYQKITYNLDENRTTFNILDELNGWKEKKKLSKDEFEQLLSSSKPSGKNTISLREEEFYQKINQKFDDNIKIFTPIYHPYILFLKRKDNYTTYIQTLLKYKKHIYHINPKYLPMLLDYKLYRDHEHTNSIIGFKLAKSILQEDEDFMMKVNHLNHQKVIDEIFDFACKQNWSNYQYASIIKCK